MTFDIELEHGYVRRRIRVDQHSVENQIQCPEQQDAFGIVRRVVQIPAYLKVVAYATHSTAGSQKTLLSRIVSTVNCNWTAFTDFRISRVYQYRFLALFLFYPRVIDCTRSEVCIWRTHDKYTAPCLTVLYCIVQSVLCHWEWANFDPASPNGLTDFDE